MSRCPHRDHKGRRCIQLVHTSPLHTYVNPNQKSRRRTVRDRMMAGTKLQLLRRSRGRCEAQARYELGMCSGVGCDPHHVLPRGRGGNDSAENLLWICRVHHDWIHANPALAEGAGLLQRSEVHC